VGSYKIKLSANERGGGEKMLFMAIGGRGGKKGKAKEMSTWGSKTQNGVGGVGCTNCGGKGGGKEVPFESQRQSVLLEMTSH